MARTSNNLTLCAFSNQLTPEYWAWAAQDPTAAAVLQQGAKAVMTYLVARLENEGLEIEEAYGINHDKDQREVWSDVHQELVTEVKPLHIHGVIKFPNRAKGAPLARLASILGIGTEFVELPKSGGHSRDNMLSYLVHKKHPEKYQYCPREVATVRGPDYFGIHQEREVAWIKARAHVVKKRAAENVEDLRAKVLAGEVVKQQILLTDDLYEIYARYSRDLDEAFSVYGQRRAYRAAAKLRAGQYSINVVFVHGAAGMGKTRFANAFIDDAIRLAAQHGERWQVYRGATGNPLDDWQGEEVILLDDLRASAMDANDWLLLLDPYNASPAKARYKNKGEVAPRLIVITATIEPVEFFFYARKKGEVDEALDQFIRRLASIVKVYREDDVLRYLVSQTGRVEPYSRTIIRSDKGLAHGSWLNREVLTLEYGCTRQTEHSSDGAIAALMTGLAARSHDVPFASSGDWQAIEALAITETDDNSEREIERVEQDNIEAELIRMGDLEPPQSREAIEAELKRLQDLPNRSSTAVSV